ncbi:STAS domain-containing protein [Vibrio sp. D420a]|uniref:STAS domain-containing protein n=1 Tax=Vibrio sp. D420a TaxID=2836895 RepID=UPI0025531CF1|nr:STAS domain-containing protein [Vibrio sp. D420a]MDK9761925.1 STAS domain-containing protein [Vibrio sp. D420a]
MECLLEDSLEISTTLNKKQQYLDWLKLGSPIKVDASQVSRVDTAGLQLLVSLFQTARRDGVDIQLCNPSQTFCDAIALLGVDMQLNFKMDI